MLKQWLLTTGGSILPPTLVPCRCRLGGSADPKALEGLQLPVFEKEEGGGTHSTESLAKAALVGEGEAREQPSGPSLSVKGPGGRQCKEQPYVFSQGSPQFPPSWWGQYSA